MKASEKIRILLVDDHMVVRKGLGLVLGEASDMEVVGEAENGEEAIYLSKKLKPDIILMDVKMEGMCGKVATQMIVRHHQTVRVICLSTFANKDIIENMLEAGACGYLLKDVSAHDLTAAIRRVHNGEILTPECLADPTNEQIPETPVAKPAEEYSQLGEQQRKVLAFMTKGLTNPEIAAQMGVSVSTVRYHVSAILRKLDVSNRSEAVAVAVGSELVRSGDF